MNIIKHNRAIKPQGDIRSELSIFYALDKFFYFSYATLKFSFVNFTKKNSFYYFNLFFALKGAIKKPSLNKIKNRWKNVYNPLFGKII